MKALPRETIINFGSIVKYVEDECELNEIRFTENVNETKKLYDKGCKTSYSYFDLMDHLMMKEYLKTINKSIYRHLYI